MPAARYIRSVGLDFSKVSYEQVVEGINKLNTKKDELKDKQRKRAKDLRYAVEQMEVIKEYMEQHSSSRNKIVSKKNTWER